MEVNTKFYLVMIIVIILIVGVLGALIVGSQYMFEKYKRENPHICNETTNETNIYCYNVNHPVNSSDGGYVIIFGICILGGML